MIMLNFSYTPEQLELQRKTREFALNEILPVAWHYDEIDETPLFVLEKAFESGLMNAAIPKKYGGPGYGLVEGVIMTEEIAAACPGLATSILDNSLGTEPVLLSDNEALKEKYLPELINQFKLICFATSEPTMGSDVAGLRLKAEPDGDGYILNGTKYWITNGGLADYISVFATVDPESKHAGICAFLVEKDWEGVSAGQRIPKLGQRCSNTTGLHFDNVRVPKENVLAVPGQGFALAMRTFSHTRPGIGALAVGAGRSVMEFAIEYAKKRHAFSRAIGDYQAIQFKIAEMYQKLETSRLLTLKAAWEADNGLEHTISASIAKFYSSEAALFIANEALQIFGGYGYTRMFPIEKLLRDIRLFTIYEGTSEIQRMIVAGHAMNAYQPVMPPMEELPLLREREAGRIEEKGGEAAWRCRMCGHVHYGPEPPDKCPSCFFPKTAFKQLWPGE